MCRPRAGGGAPASRAHVWLDVCRCRDAQGRPAPARRWQLTPGNAERMCPSPPTPSSQTSKAGSPRPLGGQASRMLLAVARAAQLASWPAAMAASTGMGCRFAAGTAAPAGWSSQSRSAAAQFESGCERGTKRSSPCQTWTAAQSTRRARGSAARAARRAPPPTSRRSGRGAPRRDARMARRRPSTSRSRARSAMTSRSGQTMTVGTSPGPR